MSDSKNKKAQYDIQYAKDKLKRIPLDVSKENYDQIKSAALHSKESVNGFIKEAINERIESFQDIPFDTTDRMFGILSSCSDEEKRLIDFVGENESLFDDMRFQEGTSTYEYVAVQSSPDGGKTWMDDSVQIPDALEYFSTGWFTYRVEPLEDGVNGQFDGQKQILTIDPHSLDDESVILHEMIHLFEFVLNKCSLFYHDACIFALYKSLGKQIDNLDDRIKDHGHILNEQVIASAGGLHDILFLLKSFDLDLKKGYDLGTVFGYGYNE